MQFNYYIKEFTFIGKSVQPTDTYAKTTRRRAESHLAKISKKFNNLPEDSAIHFKQYRLYRIAGRKDEVMQVITGDKYREKVTELFKQIQNERSSSNKSD